MEKSARESESKFQVLAKSAQAAILIVAKSKFLYVNPAFESIVGFTREEVLTMHFWEVVHPGMREFVKERGLARQRGEADHDRYEIKALTKDGRTKWIDLAATVIEYGGQTAILATAYDITTRNHAEAAMLSRQQAFGVNTLDIGEMSTALKVLLKKGRRSCRTGREHSIESQRTD